MLKRKGIALISVVLIGALVFVSIIGIVLKVVPEKSISNARISSERALSAAEAGLSQVIFDLRNVSFSDGGSIGPIDYSGSHYVTVPESKAIIANAPNVVDFKESDEKGITLQDYPNVTYWAKIKADSSVSPWDPEVPEHGNVVKDVPVTIYVMGTAYNNSSHTSILARKAIMVDYTVTYSKTSEFISGPETGAFKDYALFSGTSLVFQGASQVIKGNVFSNGDIVLNKNNVSDRVLDGKAYLNGDLYNKMKDPPIEDDNAIPKSEENPVLSGAHYIWLAKQFKIGEVPYNGIPVYNEDGELVPYADTRNSSLQFAIQSYLGAENVPSTISGIQSFYNNLTADPVPTGNFSTVFPVLDVLNLKANVKSAVYYIEGDAIINGNFTCQGAIYIHGDLHLNGNAKIYNPGGLAIFVDGDVIANGDAYIEGLLFTPGTIYGTGSFESKGSVVALGGIEVNGSLDITYSEINMPNTGTGDDYTGELESAIDDVIQGDFTWKEISYDKFLNP